MLGFLDVKMQGNMIIINRDYQQPWLSSTYLWSQILTLMSEASQMFHKYSNKSSPQVLCFYQQKDSIALAWLVVTYDQVVHWSVFRTIFKTRVDPKHNLEAVF